MPSPLRLPPAPAAASSVRRVVKAVQRRIPAPLRPLVERQVGRYRLRSGDVLFDEESLENAFAAALRRVGGADAGAGVGDYLEFGVYLGTSLGCMERASASLGLRGLRLFGFDSFEGLPAAADEEDERFWYPRQYAVGHRFTLDALRRRGVDLERVRLVPGWFDETLGPGAAARLGIARAAVILVDCDLYSSARTCLEFCAPLIAPEAVVFFDDWDAGGLAERGLGERRAFEEFLAAHPEFSADPFPSYSPESRAFVVSRR